MASNDFEKRGRVIGIALAFVAAIAISYSVGNGNGNKAGYSEGYEVGAKDSWERAVEATTEKAYWLGVLDACQTVFDATGWEYIYVNPLAGGGTISREYFCRDNGNYENTPVVEVPYESGAENSN